MFRKQRPTNLGAPGVTKIQFDLRRLETFRIAGALMTRPILVKRRMISDGTMPLPDVVKEYLNWTPPPVNRNAYLASLAAAA